MKNYLRSTQLARYVLFICLVLLSACQSTSRPKNLSGNTSVTDSLLALPKYNLSAPGKMPQAEMQKIKTACEQWYDKSLSGTVFNGAVLVAQKGNILFEKYKGTLHLEGNDNITASSIFHIASVSKTFTAMAILKLCQQGKILLDEELSHYFPGFNYPGVTVR